jgi:hypothetical protein
MTEMRPLPYKRLTGHLVISIIHNGGWRAAR